MTTQNIEPQIELITPEKAEHLLSLNMRNRPLNLNRVRLYVAAMRAGDWRCNGEAIKISTENELIDGQHRLQAVLECGIPQKMLVVRGLDPNVIATLDTGRVRTSGDVLAITYKGEINTADALCLTSAAKFLISYEAGSKWFNPKAGVNNALSNENVTTYIAANESELILNMEWLKETLPNRSGLLTSAHRLFLFTIFNRLDPEEAQNFILKVFKGVGLEDTGTAYFLREYLLRVRQRTVKHSQAQVLHTVVKCWNSLRAGRNIVHAGNIRAREEDAYFAK